MRMDSGNSYSLKEIFSGVNDKIVIPDLQRDYCWGNEDCKLVSKFLDTILDLDRSGKWPMGLIYGYVDKLYPEHIQLCDGQQRLTTLFLIVGVINKLLPGNKYQQVLISDFELNQDDQEPYLQYAIRESSLYFLSELTCHYFLGLSKIVIESANQIPNQPWYLSIYEQDPSVRSILNAVNLITEKLTQRDDLEELGDFIVNKMEFMFYDMNGRTNGEETFVVINTTGEPLSANQNLKPKMINEYEDKFSDIAQKWEEMETWFWRKRNRDEIIPHTSDEGMMEFLHCLMVLIKYQTTNKIEFVEENEEFPYKSIDFDMLYQYYKAYQKMYTTNYTERDKNPKYPYSQENLFIILPMLYYCHCYPNADQDDMKRTYHLFSNLSRYVDLSRPADSIARAMKIVEAMNDKDVLCLKDKSELRKEERKKLSLIATAGNGRTRMELLFAKAESNPIFNGQISILLQWSNNDMDKLQYYLNRVNYLWCDDNDKKDSLRRALLTRGLKNYPLLLSNKNHHTLGGKNSEWYMIFEKNTDDIKAFLDDKQLLQKMIDNYSDTNSLFYTIIKDADILRMSKNKNIRLGDNNIIIVLEKERSNADYLIIYGGKKFPKKFLPKGWNSLWDYQGRLYTDHIKYNLTIDYIYKQGKGYMILLWSGKDKKKRKKDYTNLCAIQKLGLHQSIKGEECWATDFILDGNEAQSKLIEIAKWVGE